MKRLLFSNKFTTRPCFLPALWSKWATCSGFIDQEQRRRRACFFSCRWAERRGEEVSGTPGIPWQPPCQGPPRWWLDKVTRCILLLTPADTKDCSAQWELVLMHVIIHSLWPLCWSWKEAAGCQKSGCFMKAYLYDWGWVESVKMEGNNFHDGW